MALSFNKSEEVPEVLGEPDPEVFAREAPIRTRKAPQAPACLTDECRKEAVDHGLCGGHWASRRGDHG